MAVGADGYFAQDVLGRDDREEIGKGRSSDGREKKMASGLQKLSAGSEKAGRVVDMLEHLHGAYDVEALWVS